MRDPLKSDPLVRHATEFWHLAHDVHKDLQLVLPASAHRVSEAACVIVHLTIHASGRAAASKGRQWRLRKAMRAAAAARARLTRMRRLYPDRLIASAAMEIAERLYQSLSESLENAKRETA